MSSASALDLRLPIGGLFTVLGVLLVGYGAATAGNTELYARSESININLWWGAVMLVVGLVMLYAGVRASRTGHPSGPRPAEETPAGRQTEIEEHRKGLER